MHTIQIHMVHAIQVQTDTGTHKYTHNTDSYMVDAIQSIQGAVGIPDICPFWYATILFGLEKVRQKSA